ncbi:MAG: ABC transporter, permease protein 2 (cluster 1, maltose/g3p/polyamine/iron), partial [uncultured Pseudonocardia sp.]
EQRRRRRPAARHPREPDLGRDRDGLPRARRGLLPAARVLAGRQRHQVATRPGDHQRLLVRRPPAGPEPHRPVHPRRRRVRPVGAEQPALRRARRGRRHRAGRDGRLRHREVRLPRSRAAVRVRPGRGARAGDGARAAAVPHVRRHRAHQLVLGGVPAEHRQPVRGVPLAGLRRREHPGRGAGGRPGRRRGRDPDLLHDRGADARPGTGDGVPVPVRRDLEQLPAAADHAAERRPVPADLRAVPVAVAGLALPGAADADDRRVAGVGAAAGRDVPRAPALLARRAHRGVDQV